MHNDIHTKVRTDKFAKQLRDRLAELKRKKPALKAAYQKALQKWREDIREWASRDEVLDRFGDIKVSQRTHYHRESLGFDPVDFFRGCPLPPEDGSERAAKTIREIQALLRQLGITGQATVTVSTSQIAALLGDAPEEA